jgi:hypothetical protein
MQPAWRTSRTRPAANDGDENPGIRVSASIVSGVERRDEVQAMKNDTAKEKDWFWDLQVRWELAPELEVVKGRRVQQRAIPSGCTAASTNRARMTPPHPLPAYMPACVRLAIDAARSL